MSTAHNIPNTAQAPDTDSSSPLAPKSSGKVSQSSASSTDSHVDALAASAKRQVANASAVAQEAVSSGAWAYPLYVSASGGCSRRRSGIHTDTALEKSLTSRAWATCYRVRGTRVV